MKLFWCRILALIFLCLSQAKAQNSPPAISGPTYVVATKGSPFAFTVSANEATSYGFLWSTESGGPFSFDSATGQLAHTPAAGGRYRFIVSATNTHGTSFKEVLLIVFAGAEDPPVIINETTEFPVQIGAGNVSFPVTATGNPTGFAFAWLNESPGSTLFDTTTVPQAAYVFHAPTSHGTYVLRVTASNAHGSDSADFTIKAVQHQFDSPRLIGAETVDTRVNSLAMYTYQPNPSTITSAGFEWLVASPGSTSFSGRTFIHFPSKVGQYSFRASVTNTAGTGWRKFIFNVYPAGTPLIYSGWGGSAVVGSAFSYQIVADQSPTGFGFAWLTPNSDAVNFNPATGFLQYTPVTAGQHRFRVTATNASGTSYRDVDLEVFNPSSGPQINNESLVRTAPRRLWNYQVTPFAAGSYTFTWLVPSTGPMHFNPATGALQHVPEQAGEYSFRVTLTNSTGTASKDVTLVVGPPELGGAPQIRSPLALEGRVGETMTYGTQAANAPTSYTGTWVGPSAGSSALDGQTGIWTHTPLATGAFIYRITAANAHGSDTKDIQLTVKSGFDEWQQAHFTPTQQADSSVSGALANPAGDGLNNLLKYSLALNPLLSAADGLPEMATTSSDWTYTYSRPAGRTDVDYAVEVSSDLANWTAAGVVLERVSTGAMETWRARYPLAGADRLFFRLKVTRY